MPNELKITNRFNQNAILKMHFKKLKATLSLVVFVGSLKLNIEHKFKSYLVFLCSIFIKKFQLSTYDLITKNFVFFC